MTEEALPRISDELRYRALRQTPPRSNNNVRRTFDLLRSTLTALEPESTLSEAELVDAFSASRNTVRLVLQRLAEQGLVTRGPKIGTTVRRSAVLRIDELVPIERWSTRGCMRGRVLETSLIPAFAAIRQRLSLPDGASVAVVEGLLLQDEIPLGLYVSYVALPPDQAENLGKDRLSVLDFLERHGVEISGSDMIISALPADEQTAAQLLIPDGAPLLSIEDVLRDRTGRPWAVCQTRCRADRVVFSAPARHRADK